MVEGLLATVIYIVIVAVVLGLILWIVQQIPLPPPFGNIVRVGVVVIGVLIVLILLLRLIGVVGLPTVH